MGDALTKGRAKEGRVKNCEEEKGDCLECSFHSIFIPGNLWQAVCWATEREGGGT